MKRNEFEAVGRQTVLTLPNRIPLALVNRVDEQKTEGPEMRNAVVNTKLVITKLSTLVVGSTMIGEKSNIEWKLKFEKSNVQRTSKIEVKSQELDIVMPEQDDERKKARRMAILDWPRRHESTRS